VLILPPNRLAGFVAVLRRDIGDNFFTTSANIGELPAEVVEGNGGGGTAVDCVDNVDETLGNDMMSSGVKPYRCSLIVWKHER
jgi:hypothetical protein